MQKKLIDFINKAVNTSKYLRSDWLSDADAERIIADLEEEAENLKKEVENVLH